MLKELEEKIRKEIPELNELGVGCVLSSKVKEDDISIISRIRLVGNNYLYELPNEMSIEEKLQIFKTQVYGKE